MEVGYATITSLSSTSFGGQLALKKGGWLCEKFGQCKNVKFKIQPLHTKLIRGLFTSKIVEVSF